MTASGQAGRPQPVADFSGFDALKGQVARLRSRVDDTAGQDLLEAVGALEVAYEELRVTDDELRAQREEITTLLEQHQADVLWRRRLAAAAPFALVRTRDDGLVEEANVAAAQMLRVSVGELVGKPLTALMPTTERRRVRDGLRAAARSHDEVNLRVTLAPRGGEPVSATAILTAVDPGRLRTSVQWALIVEPEVTGPTGSPATLTVDVATARSLAEMCRLPVHSDDRQALLHQLSVLAQRALPHAASVSITVGSPEAPVQMSSNSSLAQQVDAQQLATGEGPCIDAFRERDTVVSSDLRDDDRWPRLRSHLVDLQVAGALAVPVTVDEEFLGVLNAYARPPEGFVPSDVTVGRLVGTSVSAVLRTASDRDELQRLADNLNKALGSRAIIDQAKGIVMGRYGCSADEAFARLSAISQRSNMKLREVARLLVEDISGAQRARVTRRPGP